MRTSGGNNGGLLAFDSARFHLHILSFRTAVADFKNDHFLFPVNGADPVYGEKFIGGNIQILLQIVPDKPDGTCIQFSAFGNRIAVEVVDLDGVRNAEEKAGVFIHRPYGGSLNTVRIFVQHPVAAGERRPRTEARFSPGEQFKRIAREQSRIWNRTMILPCLRNIKFRLIETVLHLSAVKSQRMLQSV